MQVIEPVWSDEDVERLRQRNAERVRAAIERLGPSWVLYKNAHFNAVPVTNADPAACVPKWLRSKRPY